MIRHLTLSASVMLALSACASGGSAGQSHDYNGAMDLREGRYQDAVNNFSAALALDPNDVVALTDRPIAYLHLNKEDLAIADLDRAEQLAPGNWSVYSNRAIVFWHTKEYAKAAADFERAVAIRPDKTAFVVRIGFMREFTGEYTAAAAAYDRAVAAAPGWFYALAWKDHLELLMGKPEQALADFSAVIAKDPAWGYAYGGRCYARALLNRELGEAARDCDEAVRSAAPEAIYAHNVRGYLYIRTERFSDAIAEFNTTLKSFPNTAEALYGRGVAEREMKDLAAAKTDMDAATALDPEIAKLFGRAYVWPSERGYVRDFVPAGTN